MASCGKEQNARGEVNPGQDRAPDAGATSSWRRTERIGDGAIRHETPM